MNINVNYKPNKRQALFHSCGADEVVYGGAKGGGKSCALVMEAIVWGFEHDGADMYMFRETYDDLEANLIKEFKAKVPKDLYTYSETKRIATLINGTTISFRYISNESDAEGYQGRSIDWIGIDELTKHTQRSVQLLLSCLRSPKGFKPKFRATCNPGGIGHTWVKDRYIDHTRKGEITYADNETGNIIAFIPATVYDNDVIMKNDPAYIRRLENLSENEKKAFLYGDWDIFEGQYFREFKRDIHIWEPFDIPQWWQRFISLDYGLDCTAALWYAVDGQGRPYVYKELAVSGLTYSQAAKVILDKNSNDNYSYVVASPDLWNRQRESGESGFELMVRAGLRSIIKANNSRVPGWRTLKEYLLPFTDEYGKERAKLAIFSNCEELIRCLPLLQFDKKNPEDVSSNPHDITHLPESLRYGIMSRPQSGTTPIIEKPDPFHLQEEESDSVADFTSEYIYYGME